MGRAAAVRANTKSKTDAAKAKTNGFYGKKLIMAVKQGGSPDPEANTMLRDVIKAAKANNVPVDVSTTKSTKALAACLFCGTCDFMDSTTDVKNNALLQYPSSCI